MTIGIGGRVVRCSGALVLALTVAGIGDLSGTAGAATTGASVAHWGGYFERSGGIDRLTSPATFDFEAPVVQVATSNSTQYALLTDGTVWAWGLGADGELGDGGTTASPDVPVQVQFPAGVSIAYLPTDAMPFDTGLAVDTDGDAWGWGNDGAGSLCLGNSARYLSPVELPFSDVTALAGAGGHALYDAGGTVYACGANSYGELGDGVHRFSDVPVPVRGLGGGTVTALVASYDGSGALLADGSYLDWGYDGQGQLGDGQTGVASDVPVPVDLPSPVVQAVQGGSYLGNGQTLVLLADGTTWSWGDDQYGELGDGATTDEAAPVEFSPPAGVTYAELATGGTTSYAVDTSGDEYTWGSPPGAATMTPGLTPVESESGVVVQPGDISATALDVATLLEAAPVQVTPTLTWATPAAVPYGTGLSARQLDASVTYDGVRVPGDYSYSPAAGTVLGAGIQQLTVAFTPSSPADFAPVVGTATLQVKQAIPVVQWATPAPVLFGTVLGPTQLDATSLVAGTITYQPPAGRVEPVGNDPLKAVFVPADPTDYTGRAVTVWLTVTARVPGPPTGVAATPGVGQATVTFLPPTSSGGSPITSYIVTATDVSDPGGGGQSVSGGASPLTVTGLVTGDSYTFTVQADNVAGAGPPSAPSSPVTAG